MLQCTQATLDIVVRSKEEILGPRLRDSETGHPFLAGPADRRSKTRSKTKSLRDPRDWSSILEPPFLKPNKAQIEMPDRTSFVPDSAAGRISIPNERLRMAGGKGHAASRMKSEHKRTLGLTSAFGESDRLPTCRLGL